MQNKHMHKKLSTELKAILLDLDEQEKFENTNTRGHDVWQKPAFTLNNRVYSRHKKSFNGKTGHLRILTQVQHSDSGFFSRADTRSSRQTPRSINKPTFDLAKVSIGKPELPIKFKNLKTIASPCARNRIKIIIRNCEAHESLLRRKMRVG